MIDHCISGFSKLLIWRVIEGTHFCPSCRPSGRALFEAEGVISPPSADVDRNGETWQVNTCLT